MEQQPDRRWIVLAVFAVVAVGVVAAVLISSGGDSDDESSSTTAASSGGCETVGAPKPKNVSFKAPKQVLEEGESATAVVKTSCGTFEIALDTKRAPKTANSFAFLSEEGFYDDLTFHRVAPGFVIQGGDPRGDTSGGPGYAIRDEMNRHPYLAGTLGMALSGPDTGGSQWFITHSPQPHLDGGYTVFGRVTRGMDVVHRVLPGDRILRVEAR